MELNTNCSTRLKMMMNDYNKILFSCSDPMLIMQETRAMIDVLPSEVGKQLGDIVSNYFLWYELGDAHKRLNGRTISQIFAEYEECDGAEIIASGELDGVKYTAYDKPKDEVDNE